MIKTNNKLEDLVLITLSFFEPMTFSQVILDFDKNLIKEFPELDKEKLQVIINILVKKKLLKKVKIDKEIGWLRVHPKKSWWRLFF